MQAGKGYSLTLSRPRELPQICAIFSDARVAVTSMGGTLMADVLCGERPSFDLTMLSPARYA